MAQWAAIHPLDRPLDYRLWAVDRPCPLPWPRASFPNGYRTGWFHSAA